MANKSKAKGTRLEVEARDFFDSELPVTVERRALEGINDRGDLSGIPGIVLEVKNQKAMNLGPWLKEAEREALNDGSNSIGIVLHNRRQSGPKDNFATMSWKSLAILLKMYLEERE